MAIHLYRNPTGANNDCISEPNDCVTSQNSYACTEMVTGLNEIMTKSLRDHRNDRTCDSSELYVPFKEMKLHGQFVNRQKLRHTTTKSRNHTVVNGRDHYHVRQTGRRFGAGPNSSHNFPQVSSWHYRVSSCTHNHRTHQREASRFQPISKRCASKRCVSRTPNSAFWRTLTSKRRVLDIEPVRISDPKRCVLTNFKMTSD